MKVGVAWVLIAITSVVSFGCRSVEDEEQAARQALAPPAEPATPAPPAPPAPGAGDVTMSKARATPVPSVPPVSSARLASAPLLELTPPELKAVAVAADLMAFGYTTDNREQTVAGFRSTTVTGRHQSGADVMLWLRCDPDAARLKEEVDTQTKDPAGKAMLREGSCVLFLRAQIERGPKRTDVAEEILGKIKALRSTGGK